MQTGFKKLLGFTGRFSLLHLLIHSAFTFIFLNIQRTLPEGSRAALEFFSPYQDFSMQMLVSQVFRGLVCALVLFTFYETITSGRRGIFILFGAMWGIAFFASVDPAPGTIEGIIYTQTSFIEHALVVITSALQMLVFSWVLLKWESSSVFGYRRKEKIFDMNPENLPPDDFSLREGGDHIFSENLSRSITGYTIRFTLLHLITYLIAGTLFYQLTEYGGVLVLGEIPELYRPQDEYNYFFFMVMSGQIFRGIVLALLIFPFINKIIQRMHGWFLLFGLLFGLTLLGSPVFIPVTLLREAAFADTLHNLRIGIPEVMTQMILFSVVFVYWQKRLYKRWTM